MQKKLNRILSFVMAFCVVANMSGVGVLATGNETPTGTPTESVTTPNEPDSDVPVPNEPDSDVPAPNAPESNTPASSVPDGDAPAPNAPDSNTPASSVPDGDAPAPNAPDSNTPASSVPDGDAPTPNAPDFNTPASSIPDTTGCTCEERCTTEQKNENCAICKEDAASCSVTVTNVAKDALEKISLPEETRKHLVLPTTIDQMPVTWETSCKYVIDNTGKLSYDNFWYTLEGKNPVTLTASIGDDSKDFTVMAVMPTITRYEIQEVGYDVTSGWLDLYVKVVGFDAEEEQYYFNFNESKDQSIAVSFSGFHGIINSEWSFTDRTIAGKVSDVFYKRIPVNYVDSGKYSLNLTVTVDGTPHRYILPFEKINAGILPTQSVSKLVEQFDTIYVDTRKGTTPPNFDYTDLSADYRTIKDAVAAAKDGDTIVVNEGEFKEDVTITKNITIQGTDRDKTIVHGTINLQNGILKNLTVTNDESKHLLKIGSSAKNTIQMDSVKILYPCDAIAKRDTLSTFIAGNNANISIENCLFTNNSESTGSNAPNWSFGLYMNAQGSEGQIKLDGNTFSGAFRTMLPNINGNVTINNNAFNNRVDSVINGPTNGAAGQSTCITTNLGSQNKLTITNNKFNSAGAFFFQSNAAVSGNTFDYSTFDHYIQLNQIVKEKLNLTNNTFVPNTSTGCIYLYDTAESAIVLPANVPAISGWVAAKATHENGCNCENNPSAYQFSYTGMENTKTFMPGNACALRAFTSPLDSKGDPLLQVTKGDTILLNKDGAYTLSAQITIPEGVTLDGNGATITAGAAVNTLLLASAGVTIKNLTVDGNNKQAKHGIQAYDVKDVTLETVNANNFEGYGFMVNGSTVTAHNITAKDNGWGGVNVTKGQLISNDTLILFNMTAGDVGTVVQDNVDNTTPNKANVALPKGWVGVQSKRADDNKEFIIWTATKSADVAVSNVSNGLSYATMADALRYAKVNETLSLDENITEAFTIDKNLSILGNGLKLPNITISNNAVIKISKANLSSATLTGVKTTDDLRYNYWGKTITDEETNQVFPYYSDAALTKLEYRDTTISTAVAKAIADANTVLKDGTDALDGKTLANLTSADLDNGSIKTALRAKKDALNAILSKLYENDKTKLNDYLNRNNSLKNQITMLEAVVSIANTIIPIATEPVAEEKATIPTEDEKKAAQAAGLEPEVVEQKKQELAQEITKKPVESAGLAEAVAGALSGTGGDNAIIEVTLDTKVTDMTTTVATVEGETTLMPSKMTVTIVPKVVGGEKISNDQLSGRPITIQLPVPKDLPFTSVKIVHTFTEGGSETINAPVTTVKNDKNEITGKNVTFSVTRFSQFDLTFYTPKSSTGGSSSERDPESDFWDMVRESIKDAKSGATIEVNAKSLIRMPWTVMELLRENPITLVIKWDGGDTITIPSGSAIKTADAKIYYSFEELVKLFDGKQVVADKSNPSTGGYLTVEYTPATVVDSQTSPVINENTLSPVVPEPTETATGLEQTATPNQQANEGLPRNGALAIGFAVALTVAALLYFKTSKTN